jgi:glycosyltransferase involved in cell wall biosynthesis
MTRRYASVARSSGSPVRSVVQASVTLIQTVVPGYRMPVFQQLAETYDLEVFAGASFFNANVRTAPEAVFTLVPNRFTGGRRFLWQSNVLRPALRANLAIVELNPRILSTWLILLLRFLRGRKVVVWGHSQSRHGRRRVRIGRVLMVRLAGTFLAYTEADRLLMSSLVPRCETFAAPNALFPAANSPPVPTEFGADVCLVGRLSEDKKPDVAIRAYLAALPQLPPKSTLHVVGEGPMEKALRALVELHGAEDRVRFHGETYKLDELHEIYGSAMCAIASGYVGLSIVQSHWFGVPILFPENAPHAPEITLRNDSNSLAFGEGDGLRQALIMVGEGRTSFASREAIAREVRSSTSVELMVAGFAQAIAAATQPDPSMTTGNRSANRLQIVRRAISLGRSPRQVDGAYVPADGSNPVRSPSHVHDAGPYERSARRLAWITNYAPPYRQAVWSALKDVGLPPRLLLTGRDEATERWATSDEADLHPVRATPTSVAAAVRDCDVVLIGGWQQPEYVLGYLAAKARRIPVVLFYESTCSSQRFRSGPVAHFRKRMFRGADALLTVGEASTRAVLAMGVDPQRIVTGFNTVDVQAFAEGTSQRHQPRDGGHVFVYVGQFIERKNVSALLRAFAAVARSDDFLLIVGNGPLAADLQALAGELQIAEQVEFLGQLHGSDLLAAYARADTLVLPSKAEVWGLVVNEALASGLHVVVSGTTGVAPSVAHMRGVFVAEPDVLSLGQQMTASRNAWTGAIPDPEMLQHTPARSASDVATAVAVAERVHNAPRSARRSRA